MRVKHFITSINAHIDHLIGQIENHEAVAEATIEEAKQLTAKIHSQLNQSEAQNQRLTNQIEKLAEQEAQLTSLGIIRNDMTVADPFETAVRLQEVQLQLETQFTITSRLSGLSLVNYI